jgi:hypothetical protein
MSDATASFESAELLPLHAAIPRHETASAALKTLIIRRIETFPLNSGAYRVTFYWLCALRANVGRWLHVGERRPVSPATYYDRPGHHSRQLELAANMEATKP